MVRIADIIAYVCHDLDDAIRAKLLAERDVPPEIRAVIGADHGSRIATFVTDVVRCSDLDQVEHVGMSDEVYQALPGPA